MKVVSVANTEESLSRQKNFSKLCICVSVWRNAIYDAPLMVTVLIKLWEFLSDRGGFVRLPMPVLTEQFYFRLRLWCFFDCGSVSTFSVHLKSMQIYNVPLILLLEYCAPHLDASHWRVSYVLVLKSFTGPYIWLTGQFTFTILHDFNLFDVFIIF